MKIQLLGETELVAGDWDDGELSVAAEQAGLHFGAMEMFVASLALCTQAVLASYARQIEVPAGDLRIHMRWRYRERPYRIDAVDMDIEWPQLPENRIDAAARAAAACTLHRTLERGVEIDTAVRRG